jgi:hypothetical protein
MSAHQWRSQEIYAPDGTCIRVVTWHQPGSPHGDWRGTLTRPTYAPDGVQTVHVCCQAYASSELAIITCRRLQSSGLVLANGANSCSD